MVQVFDSVLDEQATVGRGEQPRPTVLLLPAAIRSHVLPSLYIADQLADRYNIVYAVTNATIAAIVTENGYQTVADSEWRVGYNVESAFLTANKQPLTYGRLLRAFLNSELYAHRQKELNRIIDEVRPDLVIIDLFACTDFWVLNPRRSEFELLFFNPMPSTYRTNGYPTVSESSWEGAKARQRSVDTPSTPRLRLADWLRRPRTSLVQWAMRQNLQRMQAMAQALPNHPIATDGTVTLLIDNVPELLLAPLAFEFSPAVRRHNQHYLGLCMREHRQDTELDAAFEAIWPDLVARRQQGQRLIYCSFGTFYEGPDRILLTFVENLLEAVRSLPNVQLICSVNRYVIETVRAWHKPIDLVHFFTRVPQLTVLAQADVFITHGGFGSIKESIHYEVPMLVYPLDLHYDQPGNALKVEHHGLGLRGTFSHERAASMHEKSLRLLEDESFRLNLARFRQAATEVPRSVQSIIHQLIRAHV